MAQQLASFPDYPQHTFTTTWGDISAKVRLTWRERLGSWYLDIFDEDDNAIVTGRRVSPRFLPLAGLALVGLPDDVLPYIDAGVRSDPYQRSELGDSVRLILLAESELVQATVVDDVIVSV